jgi:hypothetical protein
MLGQVSREGDRHGPYHPRGGRGVRGHDLRRPAVAGCGVRRAGRGLLQRAPCATATRAAPGPAPPRHPAPALPAARARPDCHDSPGHRAGAWPAALTPGACFRSATGPPSLPMTRGGRPARQVITAWHARGKEKETGPSSRTSWPPTRGGAPPAGAPPQVPRGLPAAGPGYGHQDRWPAGDTGAQCGEMVPGSLPGRGVIGQVPRRGPALGAFRAGIQTLEYLGQEVIDYLPALGRRHLAQRGDQFRLIRARHVVQPLAPCRRFSSRTRHERFWLRLPGLGRRPRLNLGRARIRRGRAETWSDCPRGCR